MKKIPRAVKRTTTAQSLHASGQCESCCCKELAALRKDKMRLDWLSKNRVEVRPQYRNRGWELCGHLAYPDAQEPSLRRHIDAAIRASRSGGKRG